MKNTMLIAVILNMFLSSLAISGNPSTNENDDSIVENTTSKRIREFDAYYQQHSQHYQVLQVIDEEFENYRSEYTKYILKECGILTNDQIMFGFLKSIVQNLMETPEYEDLEDFEFNLVESISNLLFALNLR